MVMAAKKKANVWAEQQVHSTWNSSIQTNELPYSSHWAQGVALWYNWATLCKLHTNRPCSPPPPFPLSQLWHWLENRAKQIRIITQKKSFFLTHLYALKEGRKKEKTLFHELRGWREMALKWLANVWIWPLIPLLGWGSAHD